MDLAEEFLSIVRALNAAQVPYAVCGGFAVIIYGFPRGTMDIDLLVREDDFPFLKAVVRPLGFTLDSGTITFNPGGSTVTRAHRLVKTSGEDFLVLDLLLIQTDQGALLESRVKVLWNGVQIDVVGREGLRQLKSDAGRPKDFEDLQKLGLEPT